MGSMNNFGQMGQEIKNQIWKLRNKRFFTHYFEIS